MTSFSLWRQLTTLWEFNFFLVSKVKPITKFLIYTRNRQNRPKRMTHWVCLCVPIYCRLWDPTANAIMTNQTKTTREVSNSPFYHSDMKLNVSTHLPHVRVKEATCMPRLSRSFCQSGCQLRFLIRKLWKLTFRKKLLVNDKTNSFLSNKYISQLLYKTLQTPKVNFKNLVR